MHRTTLTRCDLDNSLLGQKFPWTKVPLDKCLPWTKTPLDENPLGQMSPRTNVPLDQCPFRHMSLGQMYSGYCLTIASCDKSILGLKSPFDNSYLGQMYPGYHLTTASLDPKSPLRIVTLDNCIWTKVSSDKCLLGQLSHLIIVSHGQ